MKRAHAFACPPAAVHTASILVVAAASILLPFEARGQSSWPGYPNNNAISISTDGSVGIGTTAPAQKLDVNGNLIIEGGNSLIFGSGFANGALLSTYPGYLNLRTGATGFNIDNNAGTLNLIAIQTAETSVSER